MQFVAMQPQALRVLFSALLAPVVGQLLRAREVGAAGGAEVPVVLHDQVVGELGVDRKGHVAMTAVVDRIALLEMLGFEVLQIEVTCYPTRQSSPGTKNSRCTTDRRTGPSALRERFSGFWAALEWPARSARVVFPFINLAARRTEPLLYSL